MEIKYGNSLEFEKESGKNSENSDTAKLKKDSEGNTVIRSVFRFAISQSHQISTIIYGEICPVLNIGLKGIGVSVSKDLGLRVDDEIEGIILDIDENMFNVTGHVVHLSREGTKILCGIELISPDGKCLEKLAELIKQSKNELFTRQES